MRTFAPKRQSIRAPRPFASALRGRKPLNQHDGVHSNPDRLGRPDPIHDFRRIPLGPYPIHGRLVPEAEEPVRFGDAMVLGISRREAEKRRPETLSEQFEPPSEALDFPTMPAPEGSGKACRLKSTTLLQAPDGTDETRTTVGAGEEILLKANRRSDWTAANGTPTSKARSRKFLWKAPATGGDTRIEASPVGRREPCSMTFKAKEPNRITMKKLREDTIPAGTAGAGMRLEVSFWPKSVSFGNTELLEDPGPATNISGYFKGVPAADLEHHPNTDFVGMDENNTYRSDHAFGSGFSSPWSTGGFEWRIPNRFRLDGDSGTGSVFTTTVQRFTIDSSGAMTITKAGASVTRSP